MTKNIQKITDPETKHNNSKPVFGLLNYILIVIGIVILAIGYIALSGGGSDDPNVFNSEMFNNRRMFVAPILLVLGFVIEIVAIMLPNKKNK